MSKKKITRLRDFFLPLAMLVYSDTAFGQNTINAGPLFSGPEEEKAYYACNTSSDCALTPLNRSTDMRKICGAVNIHYKQREEITQKSCGYGSSCSPVCPLQSLPSRAVPLCENNVCKVSIKESGTEIVRYRCDNAAQTFYIGTEIAYGIKSDFGKDVIPLDEPQGIDRTLKCEILGKTIETRINKGTSVGRVDGILWDYIVNVSVDGYYLAGMGFDFDRSESYIISAGDEGTIRVMHAKGAITWEDRSGVQINNWLGAYWHDCETDNQCTIISDNCGTWSINKQYFGQAITYYKVNRLEENCRESSPRLQNSTAYCNNGICAARTFR